MDCAFKQRLDCPRRDPDFGIFAKIRKLKCQKRRSCLRLNLPRSLTMGFSRSIKVINLLLRAPRRRSKLGISRQLAKVDRVQQLRLAKEAAAKSELGRIACVTARFGVRGWDQDRGPLE